MVTFRIERLNKEFLRLIAELLASEVKDETTREASWAGVAGSEGLIWQPSGPLGRNLMRS